MPQGSPDEKVDKRIVRALRWVVAHLAYETQWPCKECGRPDATHALRTKYVKVQESDLEYFEGCHACNNDAVICEARAALAEYWQEQQHRLAKDLAHG